jgi:TolA-binding protein
MKTIDFSDFIERYNAGEMSESETQWFLKEIEGNQKLRDEVELRKKTDQILKNRDVISLRSKLAGIENKRRATVIHHKRKPYLSYAAIIGGVLVIGSIAVFSGGNLSTEKIMQEYYVPYDPPTSQRSGASGTDGDFTMALEFYNTRDYAKAAALFSKVLESRPDMQVELLYGVSNFEEKKYPEAKQSFGKVIDDKNNLYIDQAQWYLALCYLNTSESEKAKQLFKAISKEDGIYKKEAGKILRGLK